MTGRPSLVPGYERPEPGPYLAPAPTRIPVTAARTAGSRFIALSPLLVIVAYVIVSALMGIPTWALFWFVAVIGALGNVAFASWDRAALAGRGITDLPAPYWALLPPFVYLGIRGNRVFRQLSTGFAPLWLNVGVLLSLPLLNYAISTWGSGFFLASTGQ